MSDHTHNSFNLLKVLLGLLGSTREEHNETHRETIREWEAKQPELAKIFGEKNAAMLVELQRTAFEFCKNDQPGISQLLDAVLDLIALSHGDPRVMHMLTRSTRSLQSLVESAIEKEAKETAQKATQKGTKRKPKGKAKPKDKSPLVEAAEDWDKFIAEETERQRRRADAESN